MSSSPEEKALKSKLDMSGVFLKLRLEGVSTITIQYSGGGDSGEIDDIEFTTAGGISITVHENIKSTIRDFAFNDLLDDIEDWWNNDGGTGTVIINVSDLSYTIENHVRYTEYQTYNHEGKLSDKIT